MSPKNQKAHLQRLSDDIAEKKRPNDGNLDIIDADNNADNNADNTIIKNIIQIIEL